MANTKHLPLLGNALRANPTYELSLRESSHPLPGFQSPARLAGNRRFRKNADGVVSFIFSKPGDAYAANSRHGDAKYTGIIGTVICPLDDPRANTQPDAFPADNGYTPPPQ